MKKITSILFLIIFIYSCGGGSEYEYANYEYQESFNKYESSSTKRTIETTTIIEKERSKYEVTTSLDSSKRAVAKSHNINTTVSEYLPIFDESAQELYFTAMDRTGYFDFKIDFTKNEEAGGEDIFVSKLTNNQFQDSRPLTYLNTNRHESLSHITSQGNLVITGNYDENIGPSMYENGVTTTDIFVAIRSEDSFVITHLDEPVNSLYTEADAIYEEDDYVLFVSDRPGHVGDYHKKGWLFNGSTWGNTDVYISEKEGDYWSTPLNLGEKVNTPGTERTPWLSDDKKTLYLSSNGYENKIDLDVYYFTREDVNNWTEWEGPYKLTHLCTDQDDWGYKIYPSASFLSRARLLPYKTSQPAREGDGGARETNFRPNHKVYGLQTASLKKTEQTDIYEVMSSIQPDFVLKDVLFENDKFNINKSAEEELFALIDLIKVNYKSTIRIIGHTDNNGDDTYNLNLSEKRASAVKEYLNSKKVKNEIICIGMGEKEPRYDNNSASNRSKNRRVEIYIN